MHACAPRHDLALISIDRCAQERSSSTAGAGPRWRAPSADVLRSAVPPGPRGVADSTGKLRAMTVTVTVTMLMSLTHCETESSSPLESRVRHHHTTVFEAGLSCAGGQAVHDVTDDVTDEFSWTKMQRGLMEPAFL